MDTKTFFNESTLRLFENQEEQRPMEEEERTTEEVKTTKEEGQQNKERPPEEEANGERPQQWKLMLRYRRTFK